MLKILMTLRRGVAAAAAEDLADANALLLLDQQIRDVQAGFARAERALAVALAEQAQEKLRSDAIGQRVAALEARARAALAGQREDLAVEAAEAIAALEGERDAGQQAQALFAGEITQLRRGVSDAERRLGELQRGRRVARVADAVRASRRGRLEAAPLGHGTLTGAEATLTRLRRRQAEAAAADSFLDGITADRPHTVEERLAEAGFGPAVRPTAAGVLARLKSLPAKGERA